MNFVIVYEAGVLIFYFSYIGISESRVLPEEKEEIVWQ